MDELQSTLARYVGTGELVEKCVAVIYKCVQCCVDEGLVDSNVNLLWGELNSLVLHNLSRGELPARVILKDKTKIENIVALHTRRELPP